MEVAVIQVDKIQKELDNLKIGQERTWTSTRDFYENGEITKTQENKIYIKKTAGTQTFQISTIIKDKNGKKLDSGSTTFDGKDGWGTTIGNWFSSWFK